MSSKAFVLLTAVFLISFQAGALQFSVSQVCEDKAQLQIEMPVQSQSLGEMTIQVLKENQIQFQGDASGIKSIANSPVGDEALEILSDTQMRAYGWCVLVDGQQPDRMPDEVTITSETKEIHWFYAFALYDRGEWKSFCTPAYQVKPSQICPAKP